MSAEPTPLDLVQAQLAAWPPVPAPNAVVMGTTRYVDARMVNPDVWDLGQQPSDPERFYGLRVVRAGSVDAAVLEVAYVPGFAP